METKINVRTGLVESIEIVDPEMRKRIDEIKAMVKAELEAERKGV